ncbi:hypothetical protein LXL04_007677 [Taraxacum kok-saghyz]
MATVAVAVAVVVTAVQTNVRHDGKEPPAVALLCLGLISKIKAAAATGRCDFLQSQTPKCSPTDSQVYATLGEDNKGNSGILHEFQFHFLGTKQIMELIPNPFLANQTAYGIGFLFLTDSFSNSNSFSINNILPTKQPLILPLKYTLKLLDFLSSFPESNKNPVLQIVGGPSTTIHTYPRSFRVPFRGTQVASRRSNYPYACTSISQHSSRTLESLHPLLY